MGVLLHFVAACFELCGCTAVINFGAKFFWPTLVNNLGTIGCNPFSPGMSHRPNRHSAPFAASFGTPGQKRASLTGVFQEKLVATVQ